MVALFTPLWKMFSDPSRPRSSYETVIDLVATSVVMVMTAGPGGCSALAAAVVDEAGAGHVVAWVQLNGQLGRPVARPPRVALVHVARDDDGALADVYGAVLERKRRDVGRRAGPEDGRLVGVLEEAAAADGEVYGAAPAGGDDGGDEELLAEGVLVGGVVDGAVGAILEEKGAYDGKASQRGLVGVAADVGDEAGCAGRPSSSARPPDAGCSRTRACGQCRP